jgi:drug/metabolite transporter (DMT)-like permease
VSSADLAVAVPAALGSAFAFAVASALQHRESGAVDKRGALDPGLLTSLARRPWWLLGVVADVVAVALQAVALRYGPIALVQPLLVAGLPMAVLLSCLFVRRAPRAPELFGIGLCSVGLAAVAPAAATVGLSSEPERTASVVAAVLLTVLTLGLLGTARARPRLAGIATGSAAGVVTGAGSVLLAVCAVRFDHLGQLLLSVAPYAAVVVGLLGLLLSQAAFQTGQLGLPLAALSVLEPAVAVLLAVTVLHERLPTDRPGVLAVGGCGAVLAVVGVLVLSREQDSHLEPAVSR